MQSNPFVVLCVLMEATVFALFTFIMACDQVRRKEGRRAAAEPRPALPPRYTPLPPTPWSPTPPKGLHNHVRHLDY